MVGKSGQNDPSKVLELRTKLTKMTKGFLSGQLRSVKYVSNRGIKHMKETIKLYLIKLNFGEGKLTRSFDTKQV